MGDGGWVGGGWEEVDLRNLVVFGGEEPPG